jgi:hypothetical protein
MDTTRMPMDAPAPVKPLSFDDRVKEIDMFFQGTDRVHQTMRRVVEKLEAANIAYAIVGGMAVNAHRHERTTKDVDFLLTAEGLNTFKRIFVNSDFEAVPGRPRRFVDRSNGVNFDILVTGLFPGSGQPGPIAYPDPTDVSELIDQHRVVNLTTLIELKLAARRYQDFADVVNLIRVHDLDEAFQAKLHPSVHRDYVECLEECRREDDYEKRQDQAFEQMIDKDDYKQ